MKNKFALAIISGVIGVMAVGFLFKGKTKVTSEVTFTHSQKQPMTIQSSAVQKKAAMPLTEDLKPVAPWDYHQPLTADEKKEFERVETQVQKFLTWGEMDPEDVPEFRQTLFKMGDRAIADLARGLSQLTSDDIKDKATAQEIVRQIDQLAYFARTENPLAHDSIKALALRPVSWTPEGQLVNAVEANITLEAFDIYSQYHPIQALGHIQTIDKKYRPAFFTRYAYGRKLAGRTMEDIDLELKNVFGSPELALK
ncbi:MAG: hypothetical protein M3Q07_10375 [Pseudobdellovibrionaceae bacterium]|nr:hypothetical protein [Pseudobdellovibrionaceae bacterium]